MYRDLTTYKIATLRGWRYSYQQPLRFGYFRNNVKEWARESADLPRGTCEGGGILLSRPSNLSGPQRADRHEIQQGYEHVISAISHVRMSTAQSAELFLAELNRFLVRHTDDSRFPQLRSFYV